jgi:hypothetical protein
MNPHDRARALIEAQHDPESHSYSLIDVTDDKLIGVYADEPEVQRALLANVTPGHVSVLDIWHPSDCDCARSIA